MEYGKDCRRKMTQLQTPMWESGKKVKLMAMVFIVGPMVISMRENGSNA